MLGLLVSVALAASPPPVEELGAIWSTGVLDLLSGTQRDVTSSFGELVSAPLSLPVGKRGTAFELLSAALPARLRAPQPDFARDAAALVALCTRPDGARVKVDAVLEGTTRTWTLSLLAESGLLDLPQGHPPLFVFDGLTPQETPVKARLEVLRAQGWTCVPARRDGKGEVALGKAKAPARFQAPRRPAEEPATHLFDLLDEPERSLASVPSVEVVAARKRNEPRPRATAVLGLLAMADLLADLGGVTLVAVEPDASPLERAVLLLEGKEEAVGLTFRNREYGAPKFLPPADALPGAWSKRAWSMFSPKVPAELVFERSPAMDACLDALPRAPSRELTASTQGCLELQPGDAGTPLLVRRERWKAPLETLERRAAATVERFCADQRALSAHPVFLPPVPGKQRDAGPLLSAVLGWEQRTGITAPLGTLKLPADAAKKLAGSSFLELSDSELAAFSGVDLAFFSKLADFDRWELTSGPSPLRPTARHNAADAPWPEFGKLVRASQLHLRRAVKSNTLPAAAKDVREAARLAFTTETLLGQSIGINLLAVEAVAWNWAQKNGRSTAAWTPLDEETLERARRVVRTAPVFMSPMVSDETFSAARACERVTACAALTEVSAVTAGLQTLLREPWRSQLAKVRASAERPPGDCSGALARHWGTQEMVSVEDAKKSRLQEVISGAMLSAAATRSYLPELERWYP